MHSGEDTEVTATPPEASEAATVPLDGVSSVLAHGWSQLQWLCPGMAVAVLTPDQHCSVRPGSEIASAARPPFIKALFCFN